MNFVNDLYFLSLKNFLLDEKDCVELDGGSITIKTFYDDQLQYPTALFVSTLYNKEGKVLYTHFFTKPSDICPCELVKESEQEKLKFIFRRSLPIFGRKFSGKSISSNDLDANNEKELANLKKQISRVAELEFHELVGVQHKSKKLNRTL